MSDFRLNIGLDTEDLLRIRRMGDPALYLWPQYEWAMNETMDDIISEAQEWMYGHFMNPTGPLEDAFEKHPYGPFNAEIWNDMPYAARRNWGFSGETDSIGRFYPLDPGIAYAQNGIANAYPAIEVDWQLAVARALGRI